MLTVERLQKDLPWKYFWSILTCLIILPHRHRRTDRRTDGQLAIAGNFFIYVPNSACLCCWDTPPEGHTHFYSATLEHSWQRQKDSLWRWILRSNIARGMIYGWLDTCRLYVEFCRCLHNCIYVNVELFALFEFVQSHWCVTTPLTVISHCCTLLSLRNSSSAPTCIKTLAKNRPRNQRATECNTGLPDTSPTSDPGGCL